MQMPEVYALVRQQKDAITAFIECFWNELRPAQHARALLATPYFLCGLELGQHISANLRISRSHRPPQQPAHPPNSGAPVHVLFVLGTSCGYRRKISGLRIIAGQHPEPNSVKVETTEKPCR